MINALVRPADSSDHQQISNLVFFETRLHRHLDWRSPLEWLGAPFYWVLEENGQITAALACPVEAMGIAWVRLFVHTSHLTADHGWDLLWSAARPEIARAGGANVAAIAMQPWFQGLLAGSGFVNRQRIVMLEWHYQPVAPHRADGVRVRRMTETDLPEVEQTDSASFEPLWRNSTETLERAFSQALLASVAEDETGIVGYQITTGNGQRAHLARLAVHPSVQGRGAGKALLGDVFGAMAESGIFRLTVNTQSDNVTSLNLYQRMGFVRTGEQYPVYTFNVSARH